MRSAAALILLTLAACEPPNDPEGTTDAVRGDALVVGWIGGADRAEAPEMKLAEELAQSLSAKVEVKEGDLHELIGDLQAGRVHMVAGELPKSSALSEHYGMSRPVGRTTFLGEPDETVIAVMKGENGFLMRINALIGAGG